MFTHVMIGSNDLKRAKAFYDAIFAALGSGPVSLMPEGGLSTFTA
jgi:catechol 2,3-dioxygenase-like lactoylglutathione lyase family enzyme